jgi:hypothetical protein
LFGSSAKTNTSTDVAKQNADQVGVSHVIGRYHLTNKDFLNEGADEILKLGSRVIKIWFYGSQTEPASKMYPYNSQWPDVNDLVQAAKLPYYQALFNKPFTTYILNIWSMGRTPDYWQQSPITALQEKNEEEQFYDIAKYFLTQYKDTGKTFILSHHEGDWHLRGSTDINQVPGENAIASMIKWLNARQAGVTRARKEIGQHGVHVYHSAELSVVVTSLKQGKPNMVNRVLPHTHLDLVSYSCWHSIVGQKDGALLKESLDYIAKNMPDSEDFGDKNVFLGEFGLPENDYSADQVLELTRFTVKTAQRWGCPYIVYWQLYCNELKKADTPVPVKDNNDVRGFWLIKPDGTKSKTYHYLKRLCDMQN